MQDQDSGLAAADAAQADRQGTFAERETVGSTSDERVVNNSTRQQYRVLTDDEKFTVDWFKNAGAEFIGQLEGHMTQRPDIGRELAIARTKIEEAVMWAVRGITT